MKFSTGIGDDLWLVYRPKIYEWLLRDAGL